jgi:hypothetical protein
MVFVLPAAMPERAVFNSSQRYAAGILIGKEGPGIQSTTVHRRTGDLFSKDLISAFNMRSIYFALINDT